jgi:hypothetical protein
MGRLPGAGLISPTRLRKPNASMSCRETNGFVFAEPWLTQAFALTVKLSKRGHFSWNGRNACRRLFASQQRGAAFHGYG